MTTLRDIVARIKDFARERKIRPTTLARLAGLHPNTLRGMNEPNWRPRLDTLEKLEEFVDSSSKIAPQPPEAA